MPVAKRLATGSEILHEERLGLVKPAASLQQLGEVADADQRAGVPVAKRLKSDVSELQLLAMSYR